jgi:hypothetical protein
MTDDNLDKGEQYELIFGEKISYDTARKQLRGIQNLLDKLDEEEIENIDGESLLDQITIAQQNLKKERIKVQTENLQLNAVLREQSRRELIREDVIKALGNTIIDVPKHKIEIPSKECIELSLCISDPHVGNDFVIKDLIGNIINIYNTQIFEDRMWRIFNKLLSYSKDFKKVKIFDLGDSIEGVLRLSSLEGLKMGATVSAGYYGKFLFKWLNELSKVFSVEIAEANGNHSEMRLLNSKKNELPKENLAIIIRDILEIGIEASGNPNLFLLPCTEQGNVYTHCAGFDILAIHGHNEKSKLDEIYKDYDGFYPNNIDYILVGHLHYNSESENKNVIRVPSIVGTNVFAENIKKRSDAGAEILIFEKDVGLIEQHHIILN